MEKPFKSIEEQINLMHKHGLSTDADTPGILMREGYYSIVNGYKDPFSIRTQRGRPATIVSRRGRASTTYITSSASIATSER